MASVDERGRLYGRWNLLDLAVMILLVGLIPLSYAAYLLFRDQPPTLVSITPSQAEESPELFVTIKGTNLRPYMRVSAGTQQARDFVFKSTEEAELPFASLPPGTYDIVLYDSAQERFRLPQALTVSPSPLPTTKIVAIGAFGNLDATGAARLTAGIPLPGAGRIIAAGNAVPDLTKVFSGSVQLGVRLPNALRKPAIVELSCYVRAQGGTPVCSLNNITIAPTAMLMLTTPLGTTPFQIEAVRSADPVEAVPIVLRVSGAPSVLSRIAVGDRDMSGTTNELATQARVESLVRTPGGVDVKLLAQLQRADRGWLYESRILRAGGGLTFRTTTYEISGIVVDIPPVGQGSDTVNALTRLLSLGLRDADARVAAALSPKPLEPIDRYLNDSLIVTRIDRATDRLTQWWRSSATAALATSVIENVVRRPASSRYRDSGAILLIGVLVHIGLTLMQGPRPGWFWMIIPAMAAAFAALLFAGSQSQRPSV